MGYPRTFEEAVAFQSDVARQVARNRQVRNRGIKPDSGVDALLATIQSFVPPGRYRYYETHGTEPIDYDVLGIEEEVTTGLCYVRLAPCQGIRKGKPELWILVGGAQSFLAPAEVPGFRGVRFTPQDVLELD